MSDVRRPVLRYHGGKWLLAPWIIGFFPPHRIYTEVYGGAGSVLMRKKRAALVEVYNDLDSELANLFRVLREPELATRLRGQLAYTPFAREEFRQSYKVSADPVEQARRTVVRAFMGFGSDSASGAQTGFRSNGNRNSVHPASDWGRLPPSLAAVTERLLGVVIENRPALEVLVQHDSPATLHYVDPPYCPDTRSVHTRRTGKGYRHEMTDDDHRELAKVLRGLTGMVALSGYSSNTYTELYPDWSRHERATMADGALPRTEVLWLNPPCRNALEESRSQLGLGAIA